MSCPPSLTLVLCVLRRWDRDMVDGGESTLSFNVALTAIEGLLQPRPPVANPWEVPLGNLHALVDSVKKSVENASVEQAFRTDRQSQIQLLMALAERWIKSDTPVDGRQLRRWVISRHDRILRDNPSAPVRFSRPSFLRPPDPSHDRATFDTVRGEIELYTANRGHIVRNLRQANRYGMQPSGSCACANDISVLHVQSKAASEASNGDGALWTVRCARKPRPQRGGWCCARWQVRVSTCRVR
jgi:hypothetical protein